MTSCCIKLEMRSIVLPPHETVEQEESSYRTLKERVSFFCHFPKDRTRFEQLIYLVHLDEMRQSPYTLSDLSIFKKSYNADIRTRLWLRIALVSIFIFSTTGGCLSAYVQGDGLIVGSVLIAIASGLISWIATGINPDFKSDAANEHQDSLAELLETFEQVGRVLVLLTYSHAWLAKRLATDLDIDKLERVFIKGNPKIERIPELVVLKAAQCFVLEAPIPEKVPVVFDAFLRALDPSRCMTYDV